MSFDLVFFGGTGDLTWRKLMPALFQAFRHGKLPPGGRILAVARDEQTDEQYRVWLKERFQNVEGAKRPSEEEFARFGDVLAKTKKKLDEASSTIEAAQVRTRAMDRQLRKVEALPEHQASLWLPEGPAGGGTEVALESATIDGADRIALAAPDTSKAGTDREVEEGDGVR